MKENDGYSTDNGEEALTMLDVNQEDQKWEEFSCSGSNGMSEDSGGGFYSYVGCAIAEKCVTAHVV